MRAHKLLTRSGGAPLLSLRCIIRRLLLESRFAALGPPLPEGACRFCHLPLPPSVTHSAYSLCMRAVVLCCGRPWDRCSCPLAPAPPPGVGGAGAGAGAGAEKRKAAAAAPASSAAAAAGPFRSNDWVHLDCAAYAPQASRFLNYRFRLVVYVALLGSSALSLTRERRFRRCCAPPQVSLRPDGALVVRKAAPQQRGGGGRDLSLQTEVTRARPFTCAVCDRRNAALTCAVPTCRRERAADTRPCLAVLYASPLSCWPSSLNCHPCFGSENGRC